jgi:hypothetical protein
LLVVTVGVGEDFISHFTHVSKLGSNATGNIMVCKSYYCRQRSKDTLKGKVKYRNHIKSVAMIQDPLNVDSGEEFTEEKGFYAF